MSTDTPYVTLEAAAQYFQVSLSTFRGWVKKGAVPKGSYIRQGAVYRFNLPAVVTALQAHAGAAQEKPTTTGDDNE